VDRGERPAVPSAIVKYSLTERMRRVVNDAMDVQGGSGISLGPRNLLGRPYQAAPIGITVEGANILTRTMIIFGQGAVRSHPFVLREMQAVADPDRVEGLRRFDLAFFGHAGFTVSTLARAFWLALTAGRLARAPEGPARRLFQTATRLSAAFVLAADLSMIIIGSALKRKEKLSGRLADILSNLYLVSAVLQQFEERGRPVDELPLLQWACAESFRAIQDSFIGLFRNFPNRPVAWGLRLLTFPFGCRFGGADDRLGHLVAGVLLTPSPTRDRLTAGMFLPGSQDEPLGRLEAALAKVIQAEPVEKRLREAVKAGRLAGGSDDRLLEEGVKSGIIGAAEAELVRQANAARQDVIRVDDFPADYWNKG
jgi:acyl-CoA dehydrogenase